MPLPASASSEKEAESWAKVSENDRGKHFEAPFLFFVFYVFPLLHFLYGVHNKKKYVLYSFTDLHVYCVERDIVERLCLNVEKCLLW